MHLPPASQALLRVPMWPWYGKRRELMMLPISRPYFWQTPRWRTAIFHPCLGLVHYILFRPPSPPPTENTAVMVVLLVWFSCASAKDVLSSSAMARNNMRFYLRRIWRWRRPRETNTLYASFARVQRTFLPSDLLLR